jgi:hypothetical protein
MRPRTRARRWHGCGESRPPTTQRTFSEQRQHHARLSDAQLAEGGQRRFSGDDGSRYCGPPWHSAPEGTQRWLSPAGQRRDSRGRVGGRRGERPGGIHSARPCRPGWHASSVALQPLLRPSTQFMTRCSARRGATSSGVAELADSRRLPEPRSAEPPACSSTSRSRMLCVTENRAGQCGMFPCPAKPEAAHRTEPIAPTR